MKNQLISLLVQNVGLDRETAEQAVDAILDYIRNNPEELKPFLEKAGLDGIAGKLGRFLGD